MSTIYLLCFKVWDMPAAVGTVIPTEQMKKLRPKEAGRYVSLEVDVYLLPLLWEGTWKSRSRSPGAERMYEQMHGGLFTQGNDP